jgi:xylulokinase
MNCTGCPEEIQNAFSLSISQATDLASQEPPGCEDVNVLPYFTGERTPDWPHARGAIVGLTPGVLQRPGLLYRAALEGSTYSLAFGLSLCAPTCC